jgi:hypothetical protein
MTENDTTASAPAHFTRTRITHIAAGDYTALSVRDHKRVAQTATITDRLAALAASSLFDQPDAYADHLALFDSAALAATARPRLSPTLVGVILDHAAGLLTVAHEQSPTDSRAPRVPRQRNAPDEPLPGFGTF